MHFQTILYMLIWISISLVASSHAVLRKRDSRSLVGWVGIIWLAPIAGAALYLMLGINRIQRRAHALQRVDEATVLPEEKFAGDLDQDFFLDPIAAHLGTLAELVGRVVRRPLLEGNQVTLLRNGDEAYPKMIQSIDSAQHTVSLCTYIFDGDHAGKLFLNALRRAVARGVSVRLLIDDVGARYSWPTAVRKANRAGIPVARFLPVLVPWLFHYSNLRNHRKILVVDGCVGFTGGLVDLDDRVTGAFLPIQLETQCLICHGPKDQITDDVKEELAQRYPDDTATGFKDGDLRGWFWVEVPDTIAAVE